jgi:hypothetical protein
MNIKTIIDQDIINFAEILATNPEYVELDFELIKQKSSRIVSLADKPKKKKNLELELQSNRPKPLLNLNLKSQNTKVIISVDLKIREMNYRKLRTIIKQIRSYNPFIIKIIAAPIDNSQNNNLVRLLVSKTEKENLIMEINGKYQEFWQINKMTLGSFDII